MTLTDSKIYKSTFTICIALLFTSIFGVAQELSNFINNPTIEMNFNVFIPIFGIGIGLITVSLETVIDSDIRAWIVSYSVVWFASIGLFAIFYPLLMLPYILILSMIAWVVGVIVFTPKSILSYEALFREVWEYRLLLQLWTTYNIRSRYSQTLLGLGWVIVQPLLLAIVLASVFSILRERMAIDSNVPYVTFLLSGLLFWQIFAGGVQKSGIALISKLRLMQQVNFPKVLPLFITMAELLIDGAVTFLALLIINLFNQIAPSVVYVVIIPVLFLQVIFTLGLMMITSLLSVYIRDIQQLIGVMMRLLFYLTPIIYSLEIVPERLQLIFMMNPMTHFLNVYREIILYHQLPALSALWYIILVSMIAVFIGLKVFTLYSDQVSEYH